MFSGKTITRIYDEFSSMWCNRPVRETNMRRKTKRYRIQVPLTREEVRAMRKRAFEIGLHFETWLARLALEELKRQQRLPPAT